MPSRRPFDLAFPRICIRSLTFVGIGLALCAATAAAQAEASETLDIYVIDVEGGNATLFVGPSGESLLIDTGSTGGRDAQRIFEAARHAGLTQIDHLITTHYHNDHVGGAAELADLIPIRHFIDHGPDVQPGPHIDFEFMEEVYPALTQAAEHTVVRPGDRIPMSGLDVTVVTSAGETITDPLPGAGERNPYCDTFEPHTVNPTLGGPVGNTEDEYSVGTHVQFGQFRAVHLGDLTWNREFDLMCPINRLGMVDLFLVSRHGQPSSNSEVLVHAIEPLTAIMNNGPHKGGQPEVMRILYSAPRLQDVWQLHFSVLSGQEYAVPGLFIANVYDEQPTSRPIAPLAIPAGGAGAPPMPSHDGLAYWIKVSAHQDGTFTVTNSRNGFTKAYSGGAAGNSTGMAAVDAPPGGTNGPRVVEQVVQERVPTRYQVLELVRVVSGLENPWAIAFLPENRMLVSEQPGRIQLIEDGVVTEVGGLPELSPMGQGGMLDLVPHPEYEDNGWIYMTYTKEVSGDETVLAVARARLQDDVLVDFEDIFESNESTGTSFFRYGSRLAFLDDGTLLVTVGDRGMGDWEGIRDSAQNTRTHTGSVVRLNDDGSVPADNPFVDRDDFAPEIFTYGSRNSQGIVQHPYTGRIWATEHGPLGGDELNLIEAGQDYGWPNVSEGRHYEDQERWYRGTHSDAEDVVAPAWAFFPSLVPSGLAVVADTDFDERWDGNLLAGGLTSGWLLRILVEDDEVVYIEEILKGEIGRIRDVRVGPDGNIYLVTGEFEGGVYRLSLVE